MQAPDCWLANAKRQHIRWLPIQDGDDATHILYCDLEYNVRCGRS